MGGFIAKQPNGLYYCIERAKEQAEREAKDVLKHYVHSFDEVKDSFYPGNNTIEEFNEMLHEMGDEEGLGEERIKELAELLKEQ